MFAVRMPGRSHEGPLPGLTEAEREAAGRLRDHVVRLADEIGERNIWRPAALSAAADYVRARLADAYDVDEQTYSCRGVTVRNIVAERRGTGPGIVIVGAHYDTVVGSPGANDNGSGVASLLELARRLAGFRPERTLRFVGFVNEEMPFFQTGEMGSQMYARRCRERGEAVTAMISLETMGCYFDAEGSQKYPDLLRAFYPKQGNFLAFVGNTESEPLVRQAISEFRQTTAFPSEGIAAPGWIPGVAWSDHLSFWETGVSALMITDTAPFRYPYYHTPADTPDHVDYERLARVTLGVERVVQSLAGAGSATMKDGPPPEPAA